MITLYVYGDCKQAILKPSMRLCDSTHTHNMTICWCIVQDEPRLMVIRVRIVDNETYIIAQVKQSLQCDLTMSVRVNLPKQ